jgi:hypothetical protein
MKARNRHGLERRIRGPIRRAVRQECGFACVVCGKLGMHYDHFDPEFPDCKSHAPGGIALLCPTCHQDKTSRRLSNEKVKADRALAKKRWSDPSWQSQFSGGTVRLRIGTNVLEGPAAGLSFGPIKLLTVEAGADTFESWTLSGALTHGQGQVARFERNRVVACSGNWDVELQGTSLTFRAGPGKIVLELSLEPDQLGIQRLDFQWPSGFRLRVDTAGEMRLDNLRHTGRGTSGTNWVFRGNKVIAAGTVHASPAPLVHLGGPRGGTWDGFSMSDSTVVHFGGIADLSSLVKIDGFLSEDMLKT